MGDEQETQEQQTAAEEQSADQTQEMQDALAEEDPNKDLDDVSKLFAYDPFSESESEEAPAPSAEEQQARPASGDGTAPAKPAKEDKAASDPAGGEAPKQQEATPAPTPDTRDQMLEDLRQQNKMLFETLQRVTQPAGQPQEQQQEEPEVEVPTYNYNIPQQYVDALASEDPNVRQQSLLEIVRGVSQTVHREVVKQVRGEMREYVPQAAQAVSKRAQTQQDARSDFYSNHPNLDQAWLRPAIVQIASEVVSQQFPGAQGWTPQIRDAVAEEVYKRMPHLRPQQQQAQPAQQQVPSVPAAPTRKPAAQVGVGARPGTVSGRGQGHNSPGDILETLR